MFSTHKKVMRPVVRLSSDLANSVHPRLCPREDEIEALLGLDPSGSYTRSDIATKASWRGETMKIAALARCSAERVLAQARTLAELSETPLRTVLGYWLVGEGRHELLSSLGVRRAVPPHQLASLTFAAHQSGACLGAIVGVAASGLFLGGSLSAWLLGLALLPSYKLFASSVLEGWVRIARPTQPPAALRLEEVEPGLCVAIPVLVSTPEDVDAWSRTVLDNIRENPRAEAVYWILSDFGAADTENAAVDPALSAAIEAALLTVRSAGGKARWFHQKRRPGPEGRWIGWERKRGKIIEWLRANANLSESTSESVVILDVDSVVRNDGLRKLAAIARHPLNALAAHRGYIQPDVRPREDRPTKFSEWLYPQAPPDNVTTQPAFWQDAFNVGMFYGKGVVTRSASETTALAISDNTVLSHDHLEGLLAGALSVNSVVLREDSPPNWPSWAARQHRWVRGDVQLLKWIVKGCDEHAARPARLNFMARWRLAENLGMHLAPVGAFLGLLAALHLPQDGRDVWAIALALCLLFPHDIAAIAAIATPQRGLGLVPRIREELRRWRGRWRGALLDVLLLPYNAINVVDAVSRALWRMFVSRQKMLEWRSAAEVSRDSRGLRAHLRRAWPGGVFVLAVFAASVVWGKPSALVYPFGFAWLAAPFFAAFLARPLEHRA